MAGVQCAGCGRAYGISRAQQAAGVPARSTTEAGLAATLTGWLQDDAGQWFCGILDCRPAIQGKTAAGAPWWQGWASKHV